MLRSSSFAKGARLLALVWAVSIVSVSARAFDEAAAPAENEAGVAASATAEAGHGEHGGKTNPMEPQPTLAIWTLVVFIGLFAVLGKFAWKPLIQALHRREAHLEHCLQQSEKARDDAQKLLEEHKKLMAGTDDKVRDLLFQAQRDAQANAAELLKQAQSDAEATRQRAQRDIESARDQALVEIWSQSANLAVSVAGKVLDKQLDEDDKRRLLDHAIAELPPAPGAQGGVPA